VPGSEDLTVALPIATDADKEPKFARLLRALFPEDACFAKQVSSMLKRGVVTADITSVLHRATSQGLGDIDRQLEEHLDQGPEVLIRYVKETVPRRQAMRELMRQLRIGEPWPEISEADETYDWLL
jgi:hypothetical protein